MDQKGDGNLVILQKLYQYYETLLNDEHAEISRPGYSIAKVSHALVISANGILTNIIDMRVERGKNLVSREMNVPEQVKRSSGISANFMCDNSTYVLGLAKGGKKERSIDTFNHFARLHEEILGDIQDKGAIALLQFLRKWDPKKAEDHPLIASLVEELDKGGNLVFRLEGEIGYLHERPMIMEKWERFALQRESDLIAQCLVTGEYSPIARLHPNIKGVVGAQSSGASLVSFNQESFTSYGKEGGGNAPVSASATFGYTTALNYLLRNEKHRIRIGDTTTVFWAERPGLEEDLLSALFYPSQVESQEAGDEPKRFERDPKTLDLLKDLFLKLKSGSPIRETLRDEVDLNVNFYILGLAPNASRLSIRFWHMDSFGSFAEKIIQHYADLSLVKGFANEPDFIPVSLILKETAPLGDAKRIAPLLGGILMRSILTGGPYPQALYQSMISRIRADQKVNYIRASMIKACLTRNNRFHKRNEVPISMKLDEKNSKISYRLGRLFALLEKAQLDANPGINATIRDRYFGAASASPGSVFPLLLRLAQHHISKAEYGWSMDKKIEEVMNGVTQFPSHFNLEDQGLFVLGYYHQRSSLYEKKTKEESR